MLRRLHSPVQSILSDIDRYFDSPPVSVVDVKDLDWLYNWWRVHKGEMPQMAAATCGYFFIPDSQSQELQLSGYII
jgi:hypothetical protein